MEGVLVNDHLFIPMSAILAIDMSKKTIVYKQTEEDWSHGQRVERRMYEKYETCLPTRLDVAALLSKF